jgi:hypothetical protein
MSPLTILLVIGVIILVGLNVLASLFPRKQKVQVTFIPPSSVPVNTLESSSRNESALAAINVKIAQLFSRVEDLELRMQNVESPSANESEWIETVPVRKRK